MFELECYGFAFVDTTYAYSLDISEDKKAQAAAKKSRAANAGITLASKYDQGTGKFDSNAVYTNEENKVKSVVQKILAMGYRNDVNTIVMPQLTQTDKPLQFANDILFDLKNRAQGNMITEEIRRVYTQLENGRGYITNEEKSVLAESVLKTIKLQRYEGDEHYNFSTYGKYVDENGHLVGHKTANAFLKRFTCFDEYKNNHTKGIKNVRFSRTGLI